MTVYKIVPVRELTKDEIDVMSRFQDFVKTMFDLFHVGNKSWGPSSDKRGSLTNFKQFKIARKMLRRHQNEPWAASTIEEFNKHAKDMTDIFQTRRKARTRTNELIDANRNLEQAFQSGNESAIQQLADKSIELANIFKAAKRSEDRIAAEFRNPIYHQSNWLFQSTDFLEIFEKDEMQEVIDRNFNKFKYTYLTIPEDKYSDHQYIAYAILHLQDTDEPVELRRNEFVKFNDLLYGSTEFTELKKVIDDFYRTNNRKLIPKILAEIEKFPSLKDANEKAKKVIKTVYRGMVADMEGRDYISQDEALERDRTAGLISTSRSRHAARNFALRKGHLMSDERRASELGYIIKYVVDYNSIILDTEIFGGKFGESEVIIDVNKADVEDIDEV